MKPIIDPEICKHPPSRYWCGDALNENGVMITWVACCDCGTLLGEGILKGSKK